MRVGTPLDLTTERASDRPDDAVAITADALKLILLHPPDVERGVVAAVHLMGARITGELSLRHASIDVPVIFDRCRFDERVQLDGVHVKALDLNGCGLPALDGAGLQVDGDLTLDAAKVGRLSLFAQRSAVGTPRRSTSRCTMR